VYATLLREGRGRMRRGGEPTRGTLYRASWSRSNGPLFSPLVYAMIRREPLYGPPDEPNR
jgi:hypothetical protein